MHIAHENVSPSLHRAVCWIPAKTLPKSADGGIGTILPESPESKQTPILDTLHHINAVRYLVESVDAVEFIFVKRPHRARSVINLFST
jgi:hypothetical protein